jgi:hypothetical protein
LAGQVRPARGQAPAGQLQQRVGAQAVRVVLVGVATGDLEQALAHQGRQAVAHGTPPPLRDPRRQGSPQPPSRIGLRQPQQPAIAGHGLALNWARIDVSVRG